MMLPRLSPLLALTSLLLPQLALAQERHLVYDLVANRAHAHLLRGGGLAVDGGSWSFPRYVNGNIRREAWALGETIEGTPAALATHRAVFMYLPLSLPEAQAATRLRLRLLPSQKGSIKARLNGQALPPQKIASGWQVVQWSLPPGLARQGENRLDLDFGATGRVAGHRGAGALHWISLDQGATPEPPDLTLMARGQALHLPPNGGLAWYAFIPPQSTLDLSLSAQGQSCKISMNIESAAGDLTRTVTTPREITISLSPLAGQVARLSLHAGPECHKATLMAGGLAMAGTPPVTIAKARPPKNVILYLIDTLRADRLKAWNPQTRVRTPTMDRLGQEGAVFLQAYSQGNESYVSHAAIFTGQYPETNGVTQGESKLRPHHLLISEALRAAGLRTGGYTSNGFIAGRNGYEQGWHTYHNTLVEQRPYLAPGLLRQAREWIDKQGQKPYFLYVGTVDPHVTYRGHKDILPLYDPKPYRGRYKRMCLGTDLGKIKANPSRVTPRDRARIEALYDDEVDFSDRHLGEFVDFLKQKGQLDETLLVITSDHGDEFWEHGSVGHGHSIHEELIHVPIIMRYPGLVPAGVRVAEGVDTVDIFPTLVEALGQPMPESVQGGSLLPLAQGVGRGYPRPSVATHYGRTYAMRLGRYKMILGRGGKRALYDVKKDPLEREPLDEVDAKATRWLADASGLFLAYQKEWRKALWGVPSNLKGVAGQKGSDMLAGP